MRTLLALLLAPRGALALSLELSSRGGTASLSVAPGAAGPAEALQLFTLLSVLALVPAMLMLCSSFTRILVVLGLLRQALGLQQVPPTPVLVGLALLLSGAVMGPTLQRLEAEAWSPMRQGRISTAAALERAQAPVREFMLRQMRPKDLEAFAAGTMRELPGSPEDLPFRVLAPAFLLSELRIAFKIGFLLFLPFLVVDLMVAAVLNSMGLMMLPPTLFAAPLKLLLFTLVDGWGLLAIQLVHSFQ